MRLLRPAASVLGSFGGGGHWKDSAEGRLPHKPVPIWAVALAAGFVLAVLFARALRLLLALGAGLAIH